MVDNEDARPLTTEEKEVLSRALWRSVTEVPDPRIAALESEVERLKQEVASLQQARVQKQAFGPIPPLGPSGTPSDPSWLLTQLKAENAELRAAMEGASRVEAAYGLLWDVMTGDKRINQARRLLLETIDKDGQTRGLKAASGFAVLRQQAGQEDGQ